MLKTVLKSAAAFLCLCLFACKSDSQDTTINFEDALELNVAESVYKDGIALLNGTYQIPYDCPLDLKASKIKSGMKFASYFNLDMREMVPKFGDLKPKYIMIKNKNENVVYGIKRGDTLAFRLIDFP